MQSLNFARGISLPMPDAVTEKYAFLGSGGSGKTYGLSKLTELLVNAGAPVGVLDTVGKFFNIRRDASGGPHGLEIIVFGGKHADIPITPTQGAQVADAVYTLGCSFIVDVSQFRRSDRPTFMAAFVERLWERAKSIANPRPMTLVVEEAHLLMPETASSDDEYVLQQVFEEVVEVGRNFGIGLALASLRPQDVSKRVLSLVQNVFLFQFIDGPGRNYVLKWVSDVDKAVSEELRGKLASLPIGTCYCWSPRFLRVFAETGVLPKRTFDFSQTLVRQPAAHLHARPAGGGGGAEPSDRHVRELPRLPALQQPRDRAQQRHRHRRDLPPMNWRRELESAGALLFHLACFVGAAIFLVFGAASDTDPRALAYGVAGGLYLLLMLWNMSVNDARWISRINNEARRQKRWNERWARWNAWQNRPAATFDYPREP